MQILKKKISILDECIDNSKSKGFKIILSSAIDVPKSLADKVDYLIIDKENPIITGDDLETIGGAIFYWINNPYFKNSYCMDMNHSYAVLKLIKNAAQNSIIITKRTNKEKEYFKRGYRFQGCVDNICHFG